jgi:hypothetical protein
MEWIVVVLVVLCLVGVFVLRRRSRVEIVAEEPHITVTEPPTGLFGPALLKWELTNDPVPLGYAGKTDTECAALLTARTRTLNRITISAPDLFEAIVPAEWKGLTADEKSRVQTILSMGTVNLSGANTRASLGAAFAAGTQTRANVLALYATANGQSRAAEIGLGEVTAGDVQRARAGVW